MAEQEKKEPKPKHVPTNFDDLPASAQVPASTVATLLGISQVTVWRWTKAGKLPSPRKLGANTSRFNVGELREAISELAA